MLASKIRGVETPRFFHFVENLIEISLKHISFLCHLGIFHYVSLSEVTPFCSSRHYAFLTVILTVMRQASVLIGLLV